jgi:hypothetical protein
MDLSISFEADCSGLSIVARGSVILPVKTNAMILSETATFMQRDGKQKPERFEGEAKDIVEMSFAGGPFEQTGLLMRLVQTNEEKLETKSVV